MKPTKMIHSKNDIKNNLLVNSKFNYKKIIVVAGTHKTTVPG